MNLHTDVEPGTYLLACTNRLVPKREIIADNQALTDRLALEHPDWPSTSLTSVIHNRPFGQRSFLGALVGILHVHSCVHASRYAGSSVWADGPFVAEVRDPLRFSRPRPLGALSSHGGCTPVSDEAREWGSDALTTIYVHGDRAYREFL